MLPDPVVHVCTRVCAYMNKLPMLSRELYIAVRKETILARSNRLPSREITYRANTHQDSPDGCLGPRVILLRTLDTADG